MQIDLESLLETFATVKSKNKYPRNGDLVECLLPTGAMPTTFYPVDQIPETTDGPIKAAFKFDGGKWVLLI